MASSAALSALTGVEPVSAMLLIIWHSRTGASRAMAEAAAKGTGEYGRLLAAERAGPDDLLGATGYLFVAPENLGTLSGAMKEMFDRNYYPLLGRIEGRPYASMISAGSDGHGAQAQLDRIVTGWRLRRVADPMIVNVAAQTSEEILAEKHLNAPTLRGCANLGAALAEGLQAGIF